MFLNFNHFIYADSSSINLWRFAEANLVTSYIYSSKNPSKCKNSKTTKAGPTSKYLKSSKKAGFAFSKT